MPPIFFQALAIRHGLRLYAKTGMKPNRDWTPTAMLRVASQITGKKYKRGDYLRAADDIKAVLDEAAELD